MKNHHGAPSRRGLLGGVALAAPLLLAQTADAQAPRRGSRGAVAPPLFAYVGSYTTAQRQARGDGINVFRMDPQTGALTHEQHLGDLTNPSFLYVSRDQRFLYSVHGDEEYATAFAIEPGTGKLRVLNRGATGGRNGVRQAIDGSGRWMIVANYSSGSVAVLPVRPDGTLGDQQQLVPMPGTPGPHRTEQAASHPHDVVFDPSGRFVVIPDKGLDRVFVFAFDGNTGQLSPAGAGFVATRAGAGPRHCAFHPTRPILWVLNELDSTTATYRWDAATGALAPLQVVTNLPGDFTGNSTSAEICVSADGRFVYGSNRGHDSVVAFAARPTGELSPVAWESTQGKVPRFTTLAPGGRFFLAANEQGDNIVTFRVDLRSGKLTPTGQNLASRSPVSIVFAGG